MRMIGRRIRVSGRVQGVFFRNWAVGEAEGFGLKGWVRNRTDGSVELAAFGDVQAVEGFVRRCHAGPGSARVDRVEVEPLDGEAPERFTREPTK
jgi:acylphosphatase